jgi:hypothetical protein
VRALGWPTVMDRCRMMPGRKIGAKHGKRFIPLPWPLRPVRPAVHRRHARTPPLSSKYILNSSSIDTGARRWKLRCGTVLAPSTTLIGHRKEATRRKT